uniref:PHD finger protein 10 n=1 Tax=Macrostomum lignano TaxID=282301 RepID=A0A1I8F755_9PLAT
NFFQKAETQLHLPLQTHSKNSSRRLRHLPRTSGLQLQKSRLPQLILMKVPTKNKDSIVEHSATTASNQTAELANSMSSSCLAWFLRIPPPTLAVTEPAAAASQPPPTKRQRQQQSSRQSSLATFLRRPTRCCRLPPPQLSARQRAHQRAVKSASAFNRRFLANRPSGAVCTQTLQLLLPDKSERSAYPVAILPGQFADCCQHADSITAGSERLNYLPLTSCLYALPRRPPLPPVRLDNAVKCTVCQSDCSAWQVIECSECRSRGHAACLSAAGQHADSGQGLRLAVHGLQALQECLDPGNEERMMFCDACDRGFHTFCLGLQDIPQGHWECPVALALRLASWTMLVHKLM